MADFLAEIFNQPYLYSLMQSTQTNPRLTKDRKQQIKAAAISDAQANYFGGVSKTTAEDVFKILAIIAQFPGATPPDPLLGCRVVWSSQLLVAESLATQRFSVQVQYGKLLFNYYHPTGQSPIRAIQLPDSSFINFDNWDLHADRVEDLAIARINYQSR